MPKTSLVKIFVGIAISLLLVMPLMLNAMSSTKGVDGLPPDPGWKGKRTLEGIDSDNDGVRDDVQRKIAIRFKDQPEVRPLLFQVAKGYQHTVELGANYSQEQYDYISRSWTCLDVVRGNNYEYGHKLRHFIEKTVVNTSAREKMYDAYDSAGVGVHGFNEQTATCELYYNKN